MADNLFLYSKSLNAGNGFYNINTVSYGTTYLSTYKIHSTTVDNYRINSNILKVKLYTQVGYFTATEARKCCYCYFSDTDTFYFLNNCIIQSGYALYYLTMDLWATYFKRATLTNVCIGRSNKLIPVDAYHNVNGLYDAIPCTNEETISYLTATDLIHNSKEGRVLYNKFMLVFSLKYNVYQSGQAEISNIGLFGITFANLRSQFKTELSDPDAEPANIIDLAKQVAGGIYAIDMGTELSAEVMGVWIVETSKVLHASAGFNVKFKTQTTNFDDVTMGVEAIHPYEADTETYKRKFNITIDPDYKYYLGTYKDGVELPRTIEEQTVIIKYIVENNAIKVIACIGDTEKDITSAFALTVSHVDGDIRNSAETLHAIQSGLKLAGAGATFAVGAMSGNSTTALMGGLGFMGTVAGLQEQMLGNGVGSIQQGGDAYTSFYVTLAGYSAGIKNPYMLHRYKSIRDEHELIKHKGAIYDKYYTLGLSQLINETPIITGDTETYIKCSEITVDGIPSEAREYITGKLTNGIYIINQA